MTSFANSDSNRGDVKKCLVFLSWQSDRKDCRNFVSSVVKKLPGKVKEFADVIVDRDTVNVPGSPDIGDTIFEKINLCDLYIADITLINDEGSVYRRTPNPNVMIELGYAIKALGWERIILLQCIDYGDVEELPFDINHRRIVNFSLGLSLDNDKEKEREKSESKTIVLGKISESIKLLKEQNMLYGGGKRKAPKLEISIAGYAGIMANIRLKIKNVSSSMLSGLKIQDFWAEFEDGEVRRLDYDPKYKSLSLKEGEGTIVQMNNRILGAGPGYNNCAWSNIDIKWQMSCEDEDDNIYWYEITKHIEHADKPNISEPCITKRIS